VSPYTHPYLAPAIPHPDLAGEQSVVLAVISAGACGAGGGMAEGWSRSIDGICLSVLQIGVDNRLLQNVGLRIGSEPQTVHW